MKQRQSTPDAGISLSASDTAQPSKVLRVVARSEEPALGVADGALRVMSPELLNGGIRVIGGAG